MLAWVFRKKRKNLKGYFMKCENANGYFAQHFAKQHCLTKPWNVMEWLYLV